MWLSSRNTKQSGFKFDCYNFAFIQENALMEIYTVQLSSEQKVSVSIKKSSGKERGGNVSYLKRQPADCKNKNHNGDQLHNSLFTHH